MGLEHRKAQSTSASTRAGREVAKAAAEGIKRVTQELGGKSANIILDDTPDFGRAVAGGVAGCFGNSGQSCNAPTRMLVPKAKMAEAIEAAKAIAANFFFWGPPLLVLKKIWLFLRGKNLKKKNPKFFKGRGKNPGGGRKTPPGGKKKFLKFGWGEILGGPPKKKKGPRGGGGPRKKKKRGKKGEKI
ncbi:MAG: hypothetical protein CM1200mP40_00040 [Gammaproteobacteria bacterium]|nr:MAG: hypothetical protein CM1200mP40_00040 [Gammaproteobacteria bacterium]